MPSSRFTTRTGGRARIWKQIGNRDLWGMRFFFFTIPNYAVAHLLVNFLPFDYYRGGWILAAVLSHLVFLPIGLLVRFLVPKKAFRSRHAPLMNIGLFALAGLLKNLAEIEIAIRIGVMQEPEYAVNLTAGVLGITYLLFIYVAIFAERVNHIRAMAELVSKRDQLLELRDRSQDSLRKHEQGLRASAQDIILPRLREFEALLGSKSPVAEQVEFLRTTLATTVRPLAKQLQERRSVSYFEEFAKKTAKVPAVKFFTLLDLYRDVRPYLVWAVFLPGFVNGSILLVEADIFFRGLPALVIPLLSLVLVEQLGRFKLFKKMPLKLAAFFIIPIAAMVASWTYQTSVVDSAQLKTAILVTQLWGFGLIYMGSAFVTALSASQAKTEKMLAEYNDALRSEWELFQRDLWIANKRWGYVLHGEVQAALTTAIARLTMRPIVTEIDIEEVRSDLRRIENTLTKSVDVEIDLQSAMRDLAEVWQGVLQVNYSGSKEAVELLELDKYAKQCISEICKEAISNAFRHGNAKNVTIDLRVQDQRFALTITNDGNAPEVSRKAGIGSQMLDDLAPRWRLTRVNDLTTLQALVPSAALSRNASQASPSN
jgi:hypothetical protein